MAHVLKRETAKRDLTAQWVWYAESAGIEITDRFLAATEATLELLAKQPQSGFSVAAVRPEIQGMRRFPVGDGFERILLFYFPLSNGLDLVRVIHSSRDVAGLMVEGFFG